MFRSRLQITQVIMVVMAIVFTFCLRSGFMYLTYFTEYILEMCEKELLSNYFLYERTRGGDRIRGERQGSWPEGTMFKLC